MMIRVNSTATHYKKFSTFSPVIYHNKSQAFLSFLFDLYVITLNQTMVTRKPITAHKNYAR